MVEKKGDGNGGDGDDGDMRVTFHKYIDSMYCGLDVSDKVMVMLR